MADKHTKSGRPTADELRTLYLDKNVSVAAIAVQYGVTIQGVYYWFKVYNIPLKPNVCDVDRDSLTALWTADHTIEQIADHLNISVQTVFRRATAFGLGKKPSPHRPRGPESVGWKGGNEDYRGPVPEWKLATATVRHRDSYTCQRCALTEQQLGRPLNIRHKVPFDQFADWRDANDLQNLVGLCQACHSKVEQHPEDLPAQPDPSLQGVTEPEPGKAFIRPMVCNPQAVADLYLAGLPCRVIQDQFGINSSTLFRALRRAGIEPRRRRPEMAA